MSDNEQNLGDLLRDYFELQESKKELNDELKEVNKQLSFLEGSIIQLMENSGIESASSPFGTVSIKTEVYPSISDWDNFLTWVFENEATEFLYRRINPAPYRERLKEGMELPDGTDSYLKTRLNRRKK